MPTNIESEVIQTQTAPQVPASEVVLGSLVGIDNSGRPLVSFTLGDYQASAMVALSTQALRMQDIGRQLALLFAGGNSQAPVIMGFIHSPLSELLHAEPATDEVVPEDARIAADMTLSRTATETRIDGKRLVFEAEDEVVIKCGESSIILQKNGKVAIRGKYLVSRSSGVNRILGGSVQVN